ncbi:hypothetical protein GQ57_16110 [Burkholderia sp. MSh2]|uniref:Uncharacterized protein n=1 Tax=Burkholderia paludis TaxID=1506587 RepID=A0A6J5DDQ1_9BURK|nr:MULTISPECIES: hypothetical protein [Burkholderia]KEZ04837.1 hypothetical protein GQ57_16110 [Burkholderia sp. MSh2]CAB3750946.1 hypothetical protein LMG30113_01335 [Burkholderia paludis]VWB09553.1 hypothetical protein BPA30113_00143 [Burkholderia paludis]
MTTTENSRADAPTDDRRQALCEALTEYFVALDSAIGIDTPDRILCLFDYHDSRNVDDLIDRAIVPALAERSRSPAMAAEAVAIYQILTEEGAWLDVPQKIYDRTKSDPTLARVVYAAQQPAQADIEVIARTVDCVHVDLNGDRAAAIERLSRFAAAFSTRVKESPEQADAREGLTDEQRRTVECADAWLTDKGLPTYTKLRALAAHPGLSEPHSEVTDAWIKVNVQYPTEAGIAPDDDVMAWNSDPGFPTIIEASFVSPGFPEYTYWKKKPHGPVDVARADDSAHDGR